MAILGLQDGPFVTVNTYLKNRKANLYLSENRAPQAVLNQGTYFQSGISHLLIS